ncbi:unnamed protein product [Leptosia nina]|uniref:Uncharacterized protein n=1 Tax=Leptosia nina TaxID=320188 RepID=A0AAV1JMX2_9NEOP
MESFEDSNCPSLSDTFSMYERYMRSFNVKENFEEHNSASSSSVASSNAGNIDLSIVVPQHVTSHVCESQLYENIGKDSDSEKEKSIFLVASITSSDNTDLADARTDEPRSVKPVFISSMMENSNNAVDSVPLFDAKHENVFKLPISELSFNGTLKHVQRLKPIVDPITALGTSLNYDCDTKSSDGKSEVQVISDTNNERLVESSSDSQYQVKMKDSEAYDSNSKWNDQSYSSPDASFDSGLRSPDMFSEADDSEAEDEPEPFWSFLKDVELFEKKKMKKIQETLQGVLPPPSVTTIKTDVTQMLNKYYTFLPLFNSDQHLNVEENSKTPTKKVSFIQVPETCESTPAETGISLKAEKLNISTDSKLDINSSINDRSIELKQSSETEAKENGWPTVMKCRYHDVYYNLTNHSEKYERLLLRYAERFIGAETDTSVNIYSGGLQSPSSASKWKALRLKMAQAKSPGRRLSHLARRRQAFCSASTINEKTASNTKMVLIDKNYFPHRKLVNSTDRRSPKNRRTPGKKTPRRTSGSKTPSKTPKTGGSSKKKAMRRLLMDDKLSKTQPNRETLKRALFISPDNKQTISRTNSMSVPNQAIKSRRSLFGSPIRQAETKSMDGTSSDNFLKRKRDDDDIDTNRSKIAKSLSFGGDTLDCPQSIPLNRRASEMLSSKNSAELNELHKKKLLWAVSEALRLHGWRMSSPGFKEKASLLARLTRKLLTLPAHSAKLNAPKLSTSDTLFKLAKQYVFAIIQGRTVDECFQDEQIKLANESNKLSGYISASAYQQLKNKPLISQVKENCSDLMKPESKSVMKNVLQDKMLNVDSNSNSSCTSIFDKVALKSNSMPSFEDAAKMRAKRQISFDNVDFPKR